MIRFFLILIVITLPLRLFSANEVEVKVEDLPEVSRILLASHFNESKVVKITCNSKKHLYKVSLDKGKSITFNEEGEWVGINCNREPIPYLLIPSHIRNKIAHMYGTQAGATEIRKIKKKVFVMLNNGIEITFNALPIEE